MRGIVYERINCGTMPDFNIYYLGDKSDEEMKAAVKQLWEREISQPDYDIQAHQEETQYYGTEAQVEGDGWFTRIWIEDFLEVIK